MKFALSSLALAAAFSTPAFAAPDAVQKSDTPAVAPAATGTVSGNELSPVDRTFVTKASGAGLYEVEISKIAVERAQDPALKSFAQQMVKDHTAANEELKKFAASKGVPVATEIPAEKQAVVKKLSGLSGADFDKAYREQVGLRDHKEDIALFERQTKNGHSPDLKAWAAKTLPTLKSHYEHAQQMKPKA